jgi:hypothetical protein
VPSWFYFSFGVYFSFDKSLPSGHLVSRSIGRGGSIMTTTIKNHLSSRTGVWARPSGFMRFAGPREPEAIRT